MERNFVTLHASMHHVHDVIMTGVQSLRFRQKKAAQVSAASTDTEGFALQRAPLGNGAEHCYAPRERAPRA